MKFELVMKIGFEINDNVMESDDSFSDGVLNGDIKVNKVDVDVIDGETGEKVDMGEDNKDLAGLFMESLMEKARA